MTNLMAMCLISISCLVSLIVYAGLGLLLMSNKKVYMWIIRYSLKLSKKFQTEMEELAYSLYEEDEDEE